MIRVARLALLTLVLCEKSLSKIALLMDGGCKAGKSVWCKVLKWTFIHLIFVVKTSGPEFNGLFWHFIFKIYLFFQIYKKYIYKYIFLYCQSISEGFSVIRCCMGSIERGNLD